MATFFRNSTSCCWWAAPWSAQKSWNTKVTGTMNTTRAATPQRVAREQQDSGQLERALLRAGPVGRRWPRPPHSSW